jgi:hypothetical protein
MHVALCNLVPIIGKFRMLIFDPAWNYDWLSLAGRAKPGYAMQSLEQLRALDVMRWAEPACHLYVWTTNNFMNEACKLVVRLCRRHGITHQQPFPGLAREDARSEAG